MSGFWRWRGNRQGRRTNPQRGRGRGKKKAAPAKLPYDYSMLGQDSWLSDSDDNELAAVLDGVMAATGRSNTSTDALDDIENETLFGTVRGGIVGIKYYRGQVSNNEMVSLVREPTNQYDVNAIKVVNIWGDQVGHIKREMAAALAPLIDRKLVRVEGVVPFGQNNSFRIPIDITLWGNAENRPRVVDTLEYNGVRFETINKEPWRLGAASQSGRGKSYKPRAMPAAAQELTKAEMQSQLDQLFVELKQTEKTAMMEPAEAIASKLYPHQKQALSWMCSRENSDDLPPFWQERGPTHFLNTITNFLSSSRPPTVKGGILADEMGLGKTLSMIALILTNFQDGCPLVVPDPDKTQDAMNVDQDLGSESVQSDTRELSQLKDLESAPLATESAPTQVIIIPDEDIEITEISEIPLAEDDDVEIVPEEQIVIVLEDDTEDPEMTTTAPEVTTTAPEVTTTAPQDVEMVTTSGRPKRTCSKPARYVFSTSDDDEDLDEDIPKKKAKKKSQKTSVPASESVVDQEGQRSKEQGDQKAAAKSKEHKGGKARKKGRGKTKGEELPDPQLPSLPSLPGVSLPLSDTSSTSTSLDSASLRTVSAASSASMSCRKDSRSFKGPRSTLIVCPLSVMNNWVCQFEEHLRPDVGLNLYCHYGSERAKSHGKLTDEDVVITTYNTLAAEYKNKKGKSPLHKMEWLRVVLDEGHTIRNPNAQQTKAVLELQSQRKWILTGTPIQNSIKDLWALMAFLGIEPFKSDRIWWQRTIVRPINQGNRSAIARISQLMDQIALRRTKTQRVDGQLLVDLPTKSVFIQKVELSKEERAVYDSMAKEGKLVIGKYFSKGTLLANYGNVLAILLRLRQLCCHPALIAAAVALKEAENGDGDEGSDDLKKKLVETLLAVLSQGSDEECCICLESLHGPVITPCAHVFCIGCISEVIDTGAAARCPLCRGNISKDTLVKVPREIQQERKEEAKDDEWHSSAKVDALLGCLMREREKDPSTKSLVVSQFTSLLNLIEKPLSESGFSFVRLDGSMSAKQRARSMEVFQDSQKGSPTVMLLSLKAGGVGINLTAASRLFLMDPAWNPAAEDQCFDRCHRLGQTKDVVITKFVVKDSIEERMVELQDKKRKLMTSTFSKKLSADERRQTRINDIKALMDLSGVTPSTSA